MRSPHTANFLTCHDSRAPLVIVARPALDAAGKPVPARFDAVLGTTVIVAAPRQPFLDGARALLERGTDPDTTIILKHIGSEVESLRGRIGAAAKLTVDEDSTPRFKRWKSFSRGAVQPSMREAAPFHAEGRTGTQNRAGAEVWGMEHFETRSKNGRKHGHAGRGMAQRSLDLIEARYRHDDKWDCHGAQAPPSDAPADNLDDIPDFLLRSERVPAI